MNHPTPLRATLPPELEAVTHTFRDVGAVSPASARPLAEIPGAETAAVLSLAARGVVREATPGRYYLFTGGVHEHRQRTLTAVLIAAGSAAVLGGLPLLAWLLAR